jgi:O-antigen ligase
VQAVCFSLFLAALVLIQFLVSGTRPVFSLTAYGILAGAALISPALFRRSRLPPNLNCLAVTGLTAGYILIRAACSPVEYLAREDWFMVLAAWVVYGLTSLHLSLPRQRWLTVGVLLGLGLINSFWGVVQFFNGGDVPSLGFLKASNYGGRATGLFICPNHLAGFLEIVVLMGLSLVFWSRRPLWMKLSGGYATMMGTTALIMTGSRGGYASILVGLGVFAALSLLALHRAHHEKLRAAVIGTVALALTAGAVIGLFIARQSTLKSRTSMADDLGHTRLELWRGALRQFQMDPATGTGSGTFLYYGRLFRNPEVQGDPEHAHNDYLEFLAEYGLLGTALLLLFLGVHVFSGWKAFNWFVTERGQRLGRIQSDSLALNIGALSTVAALAAHSTVDFNLHIPANTLVMAFIMGILANPGASLPFPEFNVAWAGRRLRWVLPLIALVLVATGLRKWPAEYWVEKARVAYRDADFGRGEVLAEKGLEWDRRNPYLYLYLGQAQAELAGAAENTEAAPEIWRRAAESFQSGLKLFPEDKWLLLGLAEAMDVLGREKEAAHYYEEAVSWDPNCAAVRAQYAFYLHRTGRLAEAEKQYKVSDHLFPNHLARAGLEQLAQDRLAQRKP